MLNSLESRLPTTPWNPALNNTHNNTVERLILSSNGMEKIIFIHKLTKLIYSFSVFNEKKYT